MTKRFLLFAVVCCLSANIFAQVNIKVTVTSVSSTLDDCDSGFFGIGDSGSDPNYSWTGSNVVDNCFEFECGNGAPCNNVPQTTSLELYNENFSCPASVPSSLSWLFRGRENDTPLISCFPAGLPGGSASIQSPIIDITHTVPISATANFTQSFTENTNPGGNCSGTMSYTVSVVATGVFPPAVQDNICNAVNLPISSSYQNFAWCGNQTYEPTEFDPTTPGWLGNAFGSAWFSFVAPASGSVAIETNTNATTMGTAFVVYHAADGTGCGHGISASGVFLKDKYKYLSSIDYADDDIPLIDPEGKAAIDMNSCSNIFAGGHDLVGGETYYLQVTSDINNAFGNIAIRIRDLGGNGANPSDIPCQSPSAGVLTSAVTNININHGCSTNYEFTGNSGTSAYTYLDPTGGSNNINESNWVQFIAPNSGAARVVTDVPVLGENGALYAYDPRFAPARPNDYLCANLTQTQYSGTSSAFGGASAAYTAYCLEPGYTYYTMGDPTVIAFSSTTNYALNDPTSSAPANDILCLAMQNAAYNIPVQLLGQAAPSASQGDNTNACIERLAGELGFQNAADKTVWHYFTAPPSGVVNVSLTALTIGTAAIAVFHTLNGTSCYGGLANTTFTDNGTPTTPRIQPLGTANGAGTIVSQVCCLTPGQIYAVEVDGATPVSIGTYEIRVQEVDVQGGITSYVDTDGDTYTATSPLPALICAGESINVTGSNAVLPQGGCLEEGYLLHNLSNPVFPYNGITIYQQATPTNHFFVNNGTAPYNTRLYASAFADNAAHWGDRCPSSRMRDAAPVVFLRPISFFNSTVSACGDVTVQVQGGVPNYDNTKSFSYVITPTNNVGTVASGTVNDGGTISFKGLVVGNYTVFVSDDENCVKATTINIPSITNAVATITGANAFCIGASTTLTASGGTGYSWSNSLGNNATTLPITAAGIYTVTVTNAAGCTATATRLLNPLAPANPITITLTAPLCAISNATLNAGNGYQNYIWNTGSVTATLVVTAAAIYTVTASNAFGCTASASFNVTLNANPNAPVITQSTPLCGNSSSSFTVLDATTTPPLGAGGIYSWSNGVSVAQNTVTTAGIYTVTVTNTTGCTASATYTVVQQTIPNAPTITQTSPLCGNNGPVINGTIIAQSGYTTYAWSGSLGNTATATVVAAGVYTVTVGNGTGCFSTNSINITPVPAAILPTIIQRDSLCANRVGNLDAGNNGYIIWAWSTGGISTQSITAFTAGTYTVTVTNNFGCTNSNSIVIAQQTALTPPTIAQSNVLCSNNTSALTANGAFANYIWNTGSVTATLVVTASGTYTVTATATNGCTVIATSLPIIRHQAPNIPLITTLTNLCNNASGSIAAPSGYTYLWNNGSVLATLVVAAANTYTVTITDAVGCTNSNSLNIGVSPVAPAPVLSLQGVFCANGTTAVIAESGYQTYTWAGSTVTTNTLPISTAGLYTVTVTNLFGCSATASFNAVQLTLPTAPTITKSMPLCANKTTNLIADGNFIAYNWTGNVGGQTLTVTQSGTYTVTATDNNGCTVSSTYAVTQEAPTTVTLQGQGYFCTGNTTTLQTNIPFASYLWNTNETAQGILINTQGNYEITVTAANGCTATNSIFVSEKALPIVSAGSDVSIYLGQEVQLQGSVPQSFGLTYLWTPATTLTNSTDPTPIAAPTTTTTYTLQATTIYGCSSTDDVIVEVLDYLACLKTNEGVTPNGDTYNDTWQIPCIAFFQNTVEIYNRWGEQLYNATNYQSDWAGTYKGNDLPDGTYYYIIKIVVNQRQTVYKGTITILR
jgi:gliding motility-associated-like protein